MFYALLVLPHLLAMAGLFFFAYRASAGGEDEDRGFGDGRGGPPPREPVPGPGLGGLPLPDAVPPRRRLRVGERLAELYPRRRRREHDAPVPQRTSAH